MRISICCECDCNVTGMNIYFGPRSCPVSLPSSPSACTNLNENFLIFMSATSTMATVTVFFRDLNAKPATTTKRTGLDEGGAENSPVVLLAEEGATNVPEVSSTLSPKNFQEFHLCTCEKKVLLRLCVVPMCPSLFLPPIHIYMYIYVYMGWSCTFIHIFIYLNELGRVPQHVAFPISPPGCFILN